MVALWFGLPGVGKTTMLTKKAVDAAFAKKPRYKHIFGNVTLSGIPSYVQIDAHDLGRYLLEDALILIDEGTLQFDNRDYKNFTKELTSFFLKHRHYNTDVHIFTQAFGSVDKKIRMITDRCYYMHKTLLTGHFRTIVWRIPYGIAIPDKRDTGSANYGDIIEGYYKPPLITRLITPNLYRKKYYPYFDSWDKDPLPPLPRERFDNQSLHNEIFLNALCDNLQKTSKIHFRKRAKLTKMIKNTKKALTYNI